MSKIQELTARLEVIASLGCNVGSMLDGAIADGEITLDEAIEIHRGLRGI